MPFSTAQNEKAFTLIICDTREKKFEHITEYFKAHSIEYKVQKLDIADYMLEGKTDLVIDRKHNLSEVLQNLCSKDSSRFWREVRNASKEHIKMIVLVESGSEYKSISDVVKYKDKYSKVSGRRLANEMYRVHIAYGVEWFFCDRRSSGRIINGILTEGINYYITKVRKRE